MMMHDVDDDDDDDDCKELQIAIFIFQSDNESRMLHDDWFFFLAV